MRTDITLEWKAFGTMTKARVAMGARPCVYIQADADRRPLRVGKAPHGLAGQFRGTLAEAFDAAAHGSGNRIFVAPVAGPSCDAVQRELLWRLRELHLYNALRPTRRIPTQPDLRHKGARPRLPRLERAALKG